MRSPVAQHGALLPRLSVQRQSNSRGWLHRAFLCKPRQMRHLFDLPAYLQSKYSGCSNPTDPRAWGRVHGSILFPNFLAYGWPTNRPLCRFWLFRKLRAVNAALRTTSTSCGTARLHNLRRNSALQGVGALARTSRAWLSLGFSPRGDEFPFFAACSIGSTRKVTTVVSLRSRPKAPGLYDPGRISVSVRPAWRSSGCAPNPQPGGLISSLAFMPAAVVFCSSPLQG
jgi:hypothetical protein